MTTVSLVRLVAYGVAIAGFVVAGGCDLAEGNVKPGVIAWLLAVVNTMIFFWKP